MQSATAGNGAVHVGVVGPELRRDCDNALAPFRYSVAVGQAAREVLSFLSESGRDVAAVLLERCLSEADGMRLAREIRSNIGNLPVLIVSESSAPAEVIQAIKNGSVEFLAQPISHTSPHEASKNGVRPAEFEISPVRRSPAASMGEFVSRSRLMLRIERTTQIIGSSDAPCLIQGETGSGKEVLARRIHRHSRRAAEPFLKLNCAALPSELVESELFGYDRGAFTGAYQPKPGMFEMAEGGTLLLDEIGDMDFKLQSKLLQVLQDGEYRRLGSRESAKANVRVIAATHQDLEKLIADGLFRQDLYYRLNVIQFVAPPLRQRPEDIVPLFSYLLAKHCPVDIRVPPVTPELETALLAHTWPGNVRELENVVRRYLAHADVPALLATLRPAPVSFSRDDRAEPANRSVVLPHGPVLGEMEIAEGQAEAEAILRSLESTRWNRRQAAVLLGIDYRALLYKMRKFRIAARRTVE